MMTLLRDGGFPMVSVLLLGAVTLISAFAFAVRPDAASERFVGWMGLSTLCSVLCGVASDLATTLSVVTLEDEMPFELRIRIAMKGAAESMAPAIVGFALLSVVALMLAVGKRRLDAKTGARA
jgi:hypothetical protein